MSIILDFRGNIPNTEKIIKRIPDDNSTYIHPFVADWRADGSVFSAEQNLLAVENAILVFNYETVIFNGSTIGCYFAAYNLIRYRLMRKGHMYWLICVHPLGYGSKEHRRSAEAAGWDIMDIEL